jgi:cytochrome c biogenesis protein CcdA
MDAEPVIYTDGHGVKVTPHHFIVGNTDYRVEGITSARLFTVRDGGGFAIFLIVLGLIGIAAGFLNAFYPNTITNLEIGSTALDTQQVAIIIGTVLILFGIIILAFTHDKYAVRITTAEGIKDALVSSKKDYVSQIVAALHVAAQPSL